MIAPTTPPTTPEPSPQWVNLRDEQGRIQARYCPRLQLLMIQERKVKTVHDLSRFCAGIDEEETSVLKSP